MSETATAPEAPARPRAPRWMIGLLVVSLALNLLAFGAVAGRLWLGPHGHGSSSVLWSGLRFVRHLPPERREAVRAIIDKDDSALRVAWEKFGPAREKVIDALTAEPFGRPAFETALAQLNDISGSMRQQSVTMLGALAEALTVEERKDFARMLRSRKSRGSIEWKDRGGP